MRFLIAISSVILAVNLALGQSAFTLQIYDSDSNKLNKKEMQLLMLSTFKCVRSGEHWWLCLREQVVGHNQRICSLICNDQDLCWPCHHVYPNSTEQGSFCLSNPLISRPDKNVRLDGVVDYVGQMTEIMSQRIHSESYMKWRVDAYVAHNFAPP